MAACNCNDYRINDNGLVKATLKFDTVASWFVTCAWFWTYATDVVLYGLNLRSCAHNSQRKIDGGVVLSVCKINDFKPDALLVQRIRITGLSLSTVWTIAQVPVNSVAHGIVSNSPDWFKLISTAKGGDRFAYLPVTKYSRQTLDKLTAVRITKSLR